MIMVSHAAGACCAERWRLDHGAMVVRVRSQRTHRCSTVPYDQTTRSGHLSTAICLQLARRGHIVDRAPRGPRRPRLYRETRTFSMIHSSRL